MDHPRPILFLNLQQINVESEYTMVVNGAGIQTSDVLDLSLLHKNDQTNASYPRRTRLFLFVHFERNYDSEKFFFTTRRRKGILEKPFWVKKAKNGEKLISILLLRFARTRCCCYMMMMMRCSWNGGRCYNDKSSNVNSPNNTSFKTIPRWYNFECQ